MDNGLYLLCLCTFCEHHGPKSILVTQAIPSDLTDQLIHESSQDTNRKSYRDNNSADTTKSHNKQSEIKDPNSDTNSFKTRNSGHGQSRSQQSGDSRVLSDITRPSFHHTDSNESISIANSNPVSSSDSGSVDQNGNETSSSSGIGCNRNMPFGPGIISTNIGEATKINGNSSSNNNVRNSEFCESCQLSFPRANQYIGKRYGVKQNEDSNTHSNDEYRRRSKTNITPEDPTRPQSDLLPEVGCMRTTLKESKYQATGLWTPPVITMESISYISTQNTLVPHHRTILKQSVFKSLSSEFVFEKHSSGASAATATSVLEKPTTPSGASAPSINPTLSPSSSSSKENSKSSFTSLQDQNQNQNPSHRGSNVLASSFSHPAPFLFSSTTSSSTIALTFTLHDAVARGHRRKYGLLCIGSDETDVVKNWGMVTAWFERIAQILEMRCFEIWKDEVGITDDKEENIRRVINSSSVHTNFNYAQRSLKEITGSEDIFVEIHIWFSQMMYSLRNY
ncbi:hypothetical protein NADFUDRAFT_51397 [Nadsonia fulvescens var. elongata DSM 6958]|uniref:UDENN FLCN/SMCR8-type domain-containing protein n=1 Tax=Nadsonia fulvescens var. elongata DSM 6958 TaxID=857566 RepID=A0A1E3PLH0_9ASCO|nr:hypothetical protein NADFUDRAFT_51397 [Nadsonia fulvescens var. elongata DSM 6958]